MGAREHEVVVYASRDYGTSDGFYKGMQIKTVPSINTKALYKLSICLHSVLDVIRNGRIDLVHIHSQLHAFLFQTDGLNKGPGSRTRIENYFQV